MLEPLKDAVKTLEGDQYPTLGMTWFYVQDLFKFLHSAFRDAGLCAAADAVRRALLFEINKVDRFNNITPALQVATVMDPRFKDLAWVEQPRYREAAYHMAYMFHLEAGCRRSHADAPNAPQLNRDDEDRPFAPHALEDVKDDEFDEGHWEEPVAAPEAVRPDRAAVDGAPAADSVAAEDDGPGPEKRRKVLPTWDPHARVAASQPARGQADICPFWTEVKLYRASACPAPKEDPIAWWKTNERVLPTLAQLARRMLAVPTSSAPAERLFSHCNITVNRLRTRLSTDRSAQLLFLRLNRKALQLIQAERTLAVAEQAVEDAHLAALAAADELPGV